MRLAEWGRQLDIQYRALGACVTDHLEAVAFRARLGRGPNPDVSLALPRVDPSREQVSGEDPLDRLVGADMERHAHRVGVAAAVVQTGHKGDNRLLWDNQPKT